VHHLAHSLSPQLIAAIHSRLSLPPDAGVNMISYVNANVLFCVMAGIVVFKNSLFAPPAIIGDTIGTVAVGLVSTL
jgi:hypothetical protein